MQKRSVTLSDRLRGILSDLSSFIGQESSSAALPACESRDRDSFINRVRSFRSSSWFAKPRWLSPVMCARYGWINVDVDLLRCVGCQSVLVVRTPSSFDPAVYDACRKCLEDQLKHTAHHPCCTWPSCPTSEVIVLAHNSGSSPAVVVEDFVNKAELLYSIGKDLPAIEHSSLNISESDLSVLCSLVRNGPKFSQDAEIPGAVQSVVLLALTGWELSDHSKALPGSTSVQCFLCMRQLGLWNYISIVGDNDRAPGFERQNGGEPVFSDQGNGELESEDRHIASNCLPMSGDIITDEHRLCEVDKTQSSTGGTSFPAAVEGLLPSLTTDKCTDLCDDVELNDSTHNRSSSRSQDNERCSLADSSDKDDDIEAVTTEMPEMTDTDGAGGRADVAVAEDDESVSGLLPPVSNSGMSSAVGEVEQAHLIEWTGNAGDREKLADSEQQVTDSQLPCDTVQHELDTADTNKITIEHSKNDVDSLDVGSEFGSTSVHEETHMLNTAEYDDSEEMSNQDVGIPMSLGDGHEPCENADNITPDKSENVEDNVHDSSIPEDLSYTSLELTENSAVVIDSDKMEFVEVESEKVIQCEELNLDSHSQKSSDANTDALDLTSKTSDGLQLDESLTGESEHNTDDVDIAEDIRQLLSDLIEDVVQDLGNEDDCTRKSLKRSATDDPVSSPEPPQHKRLFSTITKRTLFNPVAEHHLWCPYVSDIVSDGVTDVASDDAHKPWLRLLRQLVPDRQNALTQIQTSPVPEGMDRIRKLFHTWTATV